MIRLGGRYYEILDNGTFANIIDGSREDVPFCDAVEFDFLDVL